MTPTEQRFLTLLECKQKLESERVEYVDELHAWMAEALEALLRHQLDLREGLRQEAIDQLNKDIGRGVTEEVMAVLRNNGIIR